jgi:hypothetical protein
MSTILFCIVPFMVLGWDASPVLNNWNAQFTVSGGMSFMTFYELVRNTYTLPGWWWLLGIAWVPAILFSVLLFRSKMPGFTDLLKVSLALILVFYLTRTWLSEPNISLILPMVLILTSLGELPKITLTITWLLPLVFTVFNTSPPQLLFLIQSNQMVKLLQWMDTFRTARLVMRVILVSPGYSPAGG